MYAGRELRNRMLWFYNLQHHHQWNQRADNHHRYFLHQPPAAIQYHRCGFRGRVGNDHFISCRDCLRVEWFCYFRRVRTYSLWRERDLYRLSCLGF